MSLNRVQRGEKPLTKAKRERARLAKWLIERGWNPPKPSARIAEAITDDIERVSGGYGGVASIEPRRVRRGRSGSPQRDSIRPRRQTWQASRRTR